MDLRHTEQDNIVIIGGGIIGLTTAYYLLTSNDLRPDTTVTLVERTAIAHGSSSKAAGLICSGWHAPALLPLASSSWECFEQLDEKYDGFRNWGWRISAVTGVRVGRDEDQAMSAYRPLPEGRQLDEDETGWVNGKRFDLSGQGRNACVDPGRFCHYIYQRCLELGLQVRIGRPIRRSASKDVLTLQGNDREGAIPYTKLVLAAGPWSAMAASDLLYPPPKITNLPGHSVIIRPRHPIDRLGSECVFVGVSGHGVGPEAATSRAVNSEQQDLDYTPSVELCTRPDGLVYIAGENTAPGCNEDQRSTHPNHLPEDPADVGKLTDPKLISRLLTTARRSSSWLDTTNGAELVTGQLCYRPLSADQKPLIGRLNGEGTSNVFVAGGHGPWGITLGPGTGKLMAEMVLGVKPSVDPSAFDPARFDRVRVRVSAKL